MQWPLDVFQGTLDDIYRLKKPDTEEDIAMAIAREGIERRKRKKTSLLGPLFSKDE